MVVNVLLFGACRDIVGSSEVRIDLPQGAKVLDLRNNLTGRFPDLVKLKSLMVAVDSEYAANEQLIGPQDEIALIPPVSGG